MNDSTTRGRRLLWWVVLVLSLTAAGPASLGAQQRSDASAEREARRHFRAGAELFYQEKYAEALVEFKRADRYTDRALVPYNIALIYSRMGEPDEAVDYAREARERGGLTGTSRLKNEGRIQGLERHRTARRVARNVRGRDTDDSSSPLPRDGSRSLSTLGWVGVGTAAAGVAALAGAGGIEGSLRDDLARYRRFNQNGQTDRARRLAGQIEGRQGTGKFLLWTGIGLTATGVTLGLLDLFGVESPLRAKRRLSIQPTVGAVWGLRIDLSAPVSGSR